MFFLLNDMVLRLEHEAAGIRLPAERFRKLTFPAVIRLGQEMYAEHPLLQRTHPERARRLAALIGAKVPLINATLFVAPKVDCEPGEVTVRFINVAFEMMAELYILQEEGRLDHIGIDKRLWRRLAA